MSTIKFFLLGKFRMETDGNIIPKIDTRKAEELCVYLLLHRKQPQSREHLADLLWGEIPPEQARSYLRKALWQLQSTMEPYCGQSFLQIDGDWLQINPDSDFWLDVDLLEKTFMETQGIRGKDLEKKQVRSIQSMVELCTGSLLEGWYQDWCLYEREHLQYLFLAMLDKLTDYYETHADYEKGMKWAERILQYDRAHERTHRRLMRLYCLAGDRTTALRQYHRCVTTLREELNVEPSEQTQLLYEMIRAGKLDPKTRSELGSWNKSRETEEPIQTLVGRLGSLYTSLSQIQTQIAQDMQIIQKTIRDKHS